tara:strand:- start:141 stop:521 length:381 start_codon:yes stop_codon:yes gene_type:complete
MAYKMKGSGFYGKGNSSPAKQDAPAPAAADGEDSGRPKRGVQSGSPGKGPSMMDRALSLTPNEIKQERLLPKRYAIGGKGDGPTWIERKFLGMTSKGDVKTVDDPKLGAKELNKGKFGLLGKPSHL